MSPNEGNQVEDRQELTGEQSIEGPAKPLDHGPPAEPALEPKPAEQPAKEAARTCTICGGPDHRGCGCEAAAEALEKVLKQDVFAATINDQLGDILTALNMIVGQLDVIIEHQKNRAAELRDVLDVDKRKN